MSSRLAAVAAAGALHFLGSKQLIAVKHWTCLFLGACHPLSGSLLHAAMAKPNKPFLCALKQMQQLGVAAIVSNLTSYLQTRGNRASFHVHGLRTMEAFYPNTTANLLRHNAWERLLACIGDAAMLHLLQHASLFQPAPNGSWLQLSGAPAAQVPAALCWAQALCCGTAARLAPATCCCNPRTHTCMGPASVLCRRSGQSCIFSSALHDADPCNVNRQAQSCCMTCRWRGGSVLCSNRVTLLGTAGQAGQMPGQAQGRAACCWGPARRQAVPL